MTLERTLCMNGGNGDDSYANNSHAQALHARSMHHLLRENLEKVKLEPPNVPFIIADLGCSCGENTISTMDMIVDHITNRYSGAAENSPDFVAYFCDLYFNDFNALFRRLPTGPRSYFSAGVPGSFHRRVLPARSVNMFYSAFALHWISQVPDEVKDKGSTAYNGGRIFIHGADYCTANAYKKRFQADLAGFISAREKEMKSGGTMFLACLGRSSKDPSDQGGAGYFFGTHFQDAWNDLVHEGLITSAQRDSFNVPVYAPSVEEFREVVESNASFAINRLEMVQGGSPLVIRRPSDGAEVGRSMASSCRAVTRVIVDAHIGPELREELFHRVERRAASNAKETLERMQFFHVVASLSLL